MDVEEKSKKETVEAASVVDCRTEGRRHWQSGRRSLNGEELAFSHPARRHDLMQSLKIQKMNGHPTSRPIENLHRRLPRLRLRLRKWSSMVDDLIRSAL